MPHGIVRLTLAIVALSLLTGCGQPKTTTVAPDPLPSWNAGPAKDAIVEFVTAVTKEGGPDYVEPAARIATFDNDGTLWSEQPVYFQVAYALSRVKEMAKDHPEWKTTQPFQAVLEEDWKAVAAAGEKGLLDIVMATHAGITTEAFDNTVREWLRTARHPRFNRPYTQIVYQPMLELLAYLRANGFQTWITSGGGVEFMRVWVEDVYGIPPEQVIGSTITTKFEMRGDKPVLVREPKLDFIDDKAGKPVAIHKFIGRRPIASFGNSDGDLEMLQWTHAGDGRRFCLYVHHTDAEREWAYDRESHIGRLDKGLDEAKAKGWTVVDMKRDWARIFPFDDE